MYICTLANVSFNRLDYGRAPGIRSKLEDNSHYSLSLSLLSLSVLLLSQYANFSSIDNLPFAIAAILICSRLSQFYTTANLRDNRWYICEIESSAPSIVQCERQPVCVLFTTSATVPCLSRVHLSLSLSLRNIRTCRNNPSSVSAPVSSSTIVPPARFLEREIQDRSCKFAVLQKTYTSVYVADDNRETIGVHDRHKIGIRGNSCKPSRRHEKKQKSLASSALDKISSSF